MPSGLGQGGLGLIVVLAGDVGGVEHGERAQAVVDGAGLGDELSHPVDRPDVEGPRLNGDQHGVGNRERRPQAAGVPPAHVDDHVGILRGELAHLRPQGRSLQGHGGIVVVAPIWANLINDGEATRRMPDRFGVS